MKRTGQCNNCGKCCTMAGLTGFQSSIICRYLIKEGEKSLCSIYNKRPSFCRQYPIHPSDIQDIPECGYRFET